MENEIWKPAPGLEGRYEVSNLGGIRCITPWRGEKGIREPVIRINKTGYKIFCARANGKPRTFRVHRLVAIAFVQNSEERPHIDHIDGNKINNRADNLRWCTPLENMNNPVTKKKMKGMNKEVAGERWKHGEFDKLKRPVAQFSLDGEFIQAWDSAAEAARGLGIRKEGICMCCCGKINKSHGYRWKYIGQGGRINARECAYIDPAVMENYELICRMEEVRAKLIER